MLLYDEEQAKKSAIVLREIADRIDRREIKYVSVLGLHTIEGAHKYGYAFVSMHAPLETIATNEYLLMLGVARDHYLDAEALLRQRGSEVTHVMDDKDEKSEFGR